MVPSKTQVTTNGAPKIGVYVCHCGINISNKVDISEVVAFARDLPNVSVSREYKFMCSEPGQELIQKDIREGKVNRVVVASCSPLMHEITFRGATEEAGENPFFFQMANIREHVSWVTAGTADATKKAKALISGAVRRVALHAPLEERRVSIHPDVLVVGGGIAGIHAALTIANSGKKVYLVEREPTIGGHMAKFDKTFPTLDCSACILTPKMTQVRSHPNIEMMTYSEVENVDGYVGNFKVKVRRKARFVDEDKCTGCEECVSVCPVNVPSEFNELLDTRKAIYRPFPQAVPNIFTIERKGVPPCEAACPLHQNAQAYITLLAKGQFLEARDVILRDNPLPEICGRICTHPCTVGCSRGKPDEPMNVPGLKRFVMDHCREEYGDYRLPEPETDRDDKIAIVGSGPAGLMCAYFLRQMGYRPVVYEAHSVAGGMLSIGIPTFRLPRDTIAATISKFEDIGIEFRLNTPVGTNGGVSIHRVKKDYEAVFLAVGAHKDNKLGVPGEDKEGVSGGIQFLRKINFGEKVDLGKQVLVIGGGNTAIDAARAARRLGAEDVTLVYRRTRKEMPADEEEIEEAEEEGIKLMFLTQPKIALGDKKVTGLECIRMRLGEEDDSGRARPVPIDDSEFILPCDNVIAAIGQKPALQDFQEALGLKTTPSDSLWADPVTLQTNVEGIFAGGDCSYQADVIVTAMADGKRAAISIDRQLRGLDMYKERDMEGSFSSDLMVDTSEVANRSKIPLPAIPLEERISFEEVHTGYTKEMAMEEASRCLNCSACCQCQLCASVCEPGAIDYGMRDKVEEVDVGAIILATGFKTFDATRIPRYGYGKYPNVFTSLEIERMVNATGPTGGGVVLKNGETPRSVGIVHCVGSRDNNYNEYCSKVCCMYSLKLAHLIKERTSAKIYNFYIDMRTPGKGYEQFYDQLLSEGTQFIRGRVSDVSDWAVIPEEEGQLVIRAEDTMIGTVRRIPVDMVVLAVGLEPQPDAEDVRRTFNISCSNEGWFLERHPKLAPVSTFTDGITLAGTCQGPKDIPDTVAQAGAAAAEVMALIDVGSMTLEPNTAFIDEENCSGCKTCVPLCPFNAITYNGDGKSGINEALCKGCGTCVAACPSGAAQQMMFTDDQIFEEIIGVLTYA